MRKKNSKSDTSPGVALFAVLFLGLIIWGSYWAITSAISWVFSTPPKTEEQIALEEAEAVENKRRGFHCLSAWDGSLSKFKLAVKDRMRDPSSFEHVETRVTPVSSDGTHTVIMDYRAKNGFGGMNLGTAMGTYQNSDCSVVIQSLE